MLSEHVFSIEAFHRFVMASDPFAFARKEFNQMCGSCESLREANEVRRNMRNPSEMDLVAYHLRETHFFKS